MKEKFVNKIEIYGRYILVGVAALCWWSIFFPQMVMNRDCYRVLDENGRPVAEESYRAEAPDWAEVPAYWEILEAEEEEVVLTSRLWEYFKDLGWVE